MLIIDKFRRRESKDRSFSAPYDQVESKEIESRKIIDFESARKALGRNDSMHPRDELFSRTFLSDIGRDRSAGVAESLVTIILVLVIGLSLLLGMIWGF